MKCAPASHRRAIKIYKSTRPKTDRADKTTDPVAQQKPIDSEYKERAAHLVGDCVGPESSDALTEALLRHCIRVKDPSRSPNASGCHAQQMTTDGRIKVRRVHGCVSQRERDSSENYIHPRIRRFVLAVVDFNAQSRVYSTGL